MEGEHQFVGIRGDQAWRLLTDPQVLQRCMPGCERIESISNREFVIELSAGVASIKGRYAGKILFDDLNPPVHFKMTMEGQGTPGFMKGGGTVDLKEASGSVVVRYVGEVQIGGPIAGVGQRMLQAVAKMMLGQLFQALDVEASALCEAERNDEPLTPPQHGIVHDLLHSLKKK